MSQHVSLPLAVFGGAGIGLLFGVIMGSSVTPTVATMLGALTTILAGILGLNDKLFNDAKAARIGAFGIACVVGAYLGIFVRSHNLLAPSLLDMKQRYLEAGFNEQQALNFIAMKEFGVSLADLEAPRPAPVVVAVPASSSDEPADNSTESTTTAPAPAVQESAATMVFKQHNSLLFGAKVDVSGCEELIHTDHTLPLDEVLNNFELTGAEWEELMYEVIEETPEEQQKDLLLLTKDAVCSIKDDEMHECKEAKILFEQVSPEQLVAAVAELNDQWAGLAEEIEFAELSTELSVEALQKIHGMLCKGEE